MKAMKKMLSAVVMLICVAMPCLAGDDVRISESQLPAKARQMLDTYFGKSKVAYATKEKELRTYTYDVAMANGVKVEFGKDGAWTEVDCGRRAVPTALVPASIRQSVKSRFGGKSIVKLERNKRGWEIELADGTDVEYSKSFRITEIDRP